MTTTTLKTENSKTSKKLKNPKSPKTDKESKLVRSAILVSIEAIFCLGLIAMIASFVINKDKPSPILLFGGFITVLVSLLILSVMLCSKCTSNNKDDQELGEKGLKVIQPDLKINTITGNDDLMKTLSGFKLSPSEYSSTLSRSDYTGISSSDKTSSIESDITHNSIPSHSRPYRLQQQQSQYSQSPINSLSNVQDIAACSKKEVQKQYSELMRTPTVEEVKQEYLKYLHTQVKFNSLKKNISEISDKYEYHNNSIKSNRSANSAKSTTNLITNANNKSLKVRGTIKVKDRLEDNKINHEFHSQKSRQSSIKQYQNNNQYQHHPTHQPLQNPIYESRLINSGYQSIKSIHPPPASLLARQHNNNKNTYTNTIHINMNPNHQGYNHFQAPKNVYNSSIIVPPLNNINQQVSTTNNTKKSQKSNSSEKSTGSFGITNLFGISNKIKTNHQVNRNQSFATCATYGDNTLPHIKRAEYGHEYGNKHGKSLKNKNNSVSRPYVDNSLNNLITNVNMNQIYDTMKTTSTNRTSSSNKNNNILISRDSLREHHDRLVNLQTQTLPRKESLKSTLSEVLSTVPRIR